MHVSDHKHVIFLHSNDAILPLSTSATTEREWTIVCCTLLLLIAVGASIRKENVSASYKIVKITTVWFNTAQGSYQATAKPMTSPKTDNSDGW